MLEQLLAKALPVYSLFFLKRWTIIDLGLTLNLTFYVLFVGYSKLPEEGPGNFLGNKCSSALVSWKEILEFFPELNWKSTGTNGGEAGRGAVDAETGTLEWGKILKEGKVGGRNSETTHGVQSVRACNHLGWCIISCSSNWSVIPL